MKKNVFFIALLAIIKLNAQQTIVKDTVVNIYFDNNVYSINEIELHNSLSFFATRNYEIKAIKGFADSNASTTYNKLLSEKRVSKVLEYLQKNKYKISNNLSLMAVGEDEFDKLSDLSKNRKVEILFELIIEKPTESKFKTADNIFYSDTLTIQLTDINFLADSPELTIESTYKLPAILTELKKVEVKKIEVKGHTNVGNSSNKSFSDFYQKLSEARALEIYSYLKNNGFEKIALSYKGVANSEPLFPNPKNKTEAQKNMRVSLKVYY